LVQRLIRRWIKLAAESDPFEGVAMNGKIYLMGAGPGDPDLLPLQAVRLLRSAEVVLRDDYISPRMLDLIPASAQVRSVNKLGVLSGNIQERIHSLLISAAREGHQVVWLKSGDPLLSGETDEEIQSITQAGVELEVISAAASALGAAAGANSR
jgi:siroheme synthase